MNKIEFKTAVMVLLQKKEFLWTI